MKRLLGIPIIIMFLFESNTMPTTTKLEPNSFLKIEEETIIIRKDEYTQLINKNDQIAYL